MRPSVNALLALPALLSAFVAAVPSPAALFQQPLNPQAPPQSQSRWRSATNRLIETVWGVGKDATISNARPKSLDDSLFSRNILAQYGSDVVLRFNISTAEEARSLADAARTLLLDVWDFTHDWVDIRLSKDVVPSLLGLLPESLQHSHTALFHERDLAYAVYNTYPTSQHAHTRDSYSSLPDRLFTTSLHQTHEDDEAAIFFKDYRPLSIIEPWMRLLSRIFATHVRLITIGQSYQGRDILAFRIGVHPTNRQQPKRPKRKTVLITGGLHAREWISTSTVNYVAYHLITSYGKKPGVTLLLEEYDFVFVPTLNPDGYVYSWETDRLWRKNRQQTSLRFCRGMDLDHAFGFEWDGESGGSPCSESYAGAQPFEAFESKQLAEWARNETEHNNVELVGFLDLHSYSQQILYPYSYSCDDAPPSQENLEELALGLQKAIRRSSSNIYEPMAACEGNWAAAGASRTLLPRIEKSGGSAIDWFYHEMHVRYSYQIKLRDRGTYGFLLPKENIIPNGKEILDAVLYLGDFLREGYPKQMIDEQPDQEDEDEPAVSKRVEDGEEKSIDGGQTLNRILSNNDEPRWDLLRRWKRR